VAQNATLLPKGTVPSTGCKIVFDFFCIFSTTATIQPLVSISFMRKTYFVNILDDAVATVALQKCNVNTWIRIR
jgi:hypothetical protein